MGGAAVDTHIHGHGGHILSQRRSQSQMSPQSPSSPPLPSTAQPPSHSGQHQLQSGVRHTLHMSVALMKSRASEQRTRRGKGPFVFTVSTVSTTNNSSNC
ncbi:hypothetical protein PTSG_13102 [Salpingoeca rosetta]|uniref:Uncharacterized protein n=1 Tax=Salpingoeca rosetta (strain ATCC 50818 / BSB-021) TaxID=946362 RepID=F2URG5_SALR5|nr:uncharacterized protein PTSG_13102 [Salpingoeca rosetta]EGD80134.1 hypothetical protein PTSG_13102 [Salpingoeca rosetta]|eukprot:XP_004988196.1 hypothetical protein PTSG_13102 [Salpingoeca rosetta]